MGVVEEARKWLGKTEVAYNVVPGITDRWGINGQAWCAAAVATWFADAGNPMPDDLVKSYNCSDWTRYAYSRGQAVDLRAGQPGDIIIFEWPDQYPWRMENGLPIVRGSGTGWDGWPAGSHVGVITAAFDGVGYQTVEANTSAPGTNGSQDNGEGVWAKYRALNLVCTVWRRNGGAGATPVVYGSQPIVKRYRTQASGLVWGVDVSEYQTSVNWAALAEAGISTAAIRLGDGAHVDLLATQHFEGARKAGILVEPYFFARDAEDPARQVARWISRADEIGTWDMPLCVDYEQASMQTTGTPLAHWVDRATSDVAARWPGQASDLYIGWYMLSDLGAHAGIAGRSVIWIPGGPRYNEQAQHHTAPASLMEPPAGWGIHAQQWTQYGWINGAGHFDLDILTPAGLDRLLGTDHRAYASHTLEDDMVRAYRVQNENGTIVMVNSNGQWWNPQPPPGFTGDWGQWEAAMKEAVGLGHIQLHSDGSLFKDTTRAALNQLASIGT